MKESFLIYKSFYEPIKSMSNENLGALFRSIFEYQLEKTPCNNADVKMAFDFFVNQFRLDEEKYKKTCEARKMAGSVGGKQRVANQANATFAKQIKQKVANQADNENEKENGKENVKEYSSEFLELWKYYQTEIKGSKQQAFNSYVGNKLNKFDIGTIKKVLDFEMNKGYGQRHLVTIFNNFKDSLEVIEEIEIQDTKSSYYEHY